MSIQTTARFRQPDAIKKPKAKPERDPLPDSQVAAFRADLNPHTSRS